MSQKYYLGDWVHINKDLGPMRQYSIADEDAIVVSSYAERYGGSNTSDYTLHIKGHGQVSWYSDDEITLIEAGRCDKLREWQEAEEAERRQKSDLDWIFAHGTEVLAHPSSDSVAALALCFGLTDLWGSRGEGGVHYANRIITLHLAEPYLQAGDKACWLRFCELIKKSNKNKETPAGQTGETL